MTEHYYKTIQGYFDFEHVYRHAVEWIPDGGTFVEVGCWKGMSLSFFLVEAKNSGKKLKVFGVDHFLGSVGDVPLLTMAQKESIQMHCIANIAKADYPASIIPAKSHEAAPMFDDGSCDYVFIDDSHDKESVLISLNAWLPKVRKGGYIAGHDINQSAVSEAVAEVLGGYQCEVLDRSMDDGGFMWGTCWRIQL